MAIGLAAFYIAAPDSDFFDLFSFIRIDLRSLRLLLNGSLLYYFLSIANISMFSERHFWLPKVLQSYGDYFNLANFLKTFFWSAKSLRFFWPIPAASTAGAFGERRGAFLKSECKGREFSDNHQIFLKVFSRGFLVKNSDQTTIQFITQLCASKF